MNHPLLFYSLFSVGERNMNQKKKTAFKKNNRTMGGQKAIFMAVARTQSFQLANIVST
jgi:hypothetical protein